MSNASASLYTAEFRDQMARECYELMQENRTTIPEFARERGIKRKCLYNWIECRYRKQDRIQSAGFVKIEKVPVSISIEYYGARIQATESDLASVLAAVRAAASI